MGSGCCCICESFRVGYGPRGVVPRGPMWLGVRSWGLGVGSAVEEADVAGDDLDARSLLAAVGAPFARSDAAADRHSRTRLEMAVAGLAELAERGDVDEGGLL